MQTPARQMYLETEVMTATPQKLQLMLIEGAIRYSLRAKTQWAQGDDTAASESLLRAQEILGELLQSASGTKNEITERLSAVYLFLYTKLTEAYVGRDASRVDEVLKVLEVERETWCLVCEKFGTRRESSPQNAIAPLLAPNSDAGFDHAAGGLSLEA